MAPRFGRATVLAVVGVSGPVLLLPVSGEAQDLTWDTTLSDGLVIGGSGTWDGTTPAWTSDAGGTNEAWTDDANATFGDIAGTVTVTGTQSVQTTTFETGGYVITGGVLSYTGADPGIAVTSGTATIASDFTSTTDLIKTGSGELVLSGAGTMAGDIVNTGGGEIRLTGSTTGGVTNSSGTFTNRGTVGGAVTMQSGSFDNGGAVNGGVTVTSGTFDNGDSGGLLPGVVTGDVLIDGSGGTVNNYSGSDISGRVTLDDGDGNGATGGTLSAEGGTFGEVVVNDGTMNVTANTTAESVTNGGGLVLIETGGVTLTTDFTQSGGTTRVAAGGTLTDTDGSVTITGGELQNNGGGTVSDDIALSGGVLVASGGAFGGDLSISGTGRFDLAGSAVIGTTTMTGGDIEFSGPFTLSTDLVQSGGTTTVAFGSTLTDADGTTLTGGAIDNSGTITNGVTVTGGTLTNTASGQINGLVTATGSGTLVASGGNFDAGVSVQTGGTATIDGGVSGDISASGGSVTITDTGSLAGSLTMSGSPGATVTVAGAIVADATDADTETVTVSGGTLITQGGADIQVATLQTGGTITGEGGSFGGGITGQGGDIDITGSVAADIVLEGSALTIASTGVLGGDVVMTVSSSQEAVNNGTLDGVLTAFDGTFTNTGTITGAGGTDAVVLAGGALSNDSGGQIGGDVSVSSGSFLANGGSVTGTTTVTGSGSFTVLADSSGDVVNGTAGGGAPTGGTVTISSGTTLTGSVTNHSGTTTVDGRLDGTLALSGGSVLTGTSSAVTGAVTVSGGTATLAGGSFGDGILSSGGTTNVTGEISLTSGALVSNDGYVSIAVGGTVNGDVATTNTGGPATAQIDTFGTINGTVTSGAGLFTNYGTIDGAAVVTGGELGSSGALLQGFTVNGGLLTLFGAGSIAGAGTVNTGGAFLVNGGSFADGVDNAGGVIEVAGNASGEIRNTEGSARIDPGRTFTGDVINGADGSFNLSTIGVGTATINGSLANNGGTANLNGTITGGTTNTGATAQMLVDSGDVANFGDAPGAGLVNSAGATLTVRGRTTGTITNEDTATVLLQGATLATGSDLRNAGQVTVTGATTASGAVSNTGTFVVGDGAAGADSLAVTGTFDNLSGGELLVAADGTVGATTFTNADGGTLDLSGTLSGAVENSGLLVYRDNAGVADADRFGGLVTNTATGSIRPASGSLFFGAGLANSGTIDLSGTSRTVGDTLTVANGFAGGGAILMDVDFTADLADRITVNGDATGSTSIVVSDVSSGEASGNDIVIASVSGAAAADAFVLATPLSIGALTYDISQVGSDFVLGLFGGFVPDVVGLEALPATLLRQESLPTLRERSALRLPGGGTAESGGFWYRLSGSSETFSPASSGTGYVGETDAVRFRAGQDFDLGETEAGRMVLGVNLGFSSAQTALSSPDGSASIDSDARSLGVSATWYGASGLYVDGQLQYTAFDAAVVSGAARGETSGTGASGALEVGQRLTVPGSDWALTPQARLAYATVDYDDFISGGGLETSLQAAESLRTSIGLSAERAAFEVGGGEGLSLHGAAFLHRELAGDMTSLIAGSEVESSLQEWSGEVSVGVSRRFAGGLGVIYGEAQYSAGFDNPGDNNALSIAIGGNLSF